MNNPDNKCVKFDQKLFAPIICLLSMTIKNFIKNEVFSFQKRNISVYHSVFMLRSRHCIYSSKSNAEVEIQIYSVLHYHTLVINYTHVIIKQPRFAIRVYYSHSFIVAYTAVRSSRFAHMTSANSV